MNGSDSVAFACDDLCKSFETRNGLVRALQGVSFSIEEGEFVCIVGPSGCGKTTLLRIIAGLLSPTSGRVLFGSSARQGNPRAILVFQEHGLFPWMTVLDNAAFALEATHLSRKERLDRARSFIEKVGLAGFWRSYPHQLSVGMRQRVAIVRAFLADPDVMLMDEPLGALDAQMRRVLLEELVRIWQANRKTIVYVSHDVEEAVRVGDRVLVMTGRPGRISEEITIPLPRPRDLSATEHPVVTDLKWHIWNMLEGEVRRDLHLQNRLGELI